MNDLSEGDSQKLHEALNQLHADKTPTRTFEAAIEMPKYQSHKKVWALKIQFILMDAELAKIDNRETDGSALLTFDDSRYVPKRVDAEYMHKHKPQAGGYFVVYEDGYLSWSPAQAFEEGYTLV
jgi:hypothetical protein